MDASPEDIKKAYRQKAKEKHPDVNDSVSQQSCSGNGAVFSARQAAAASSRTAGETGLAVKAPPSAEQRTARAAYPGVAIVCSAGPQHLRRAAGCAPAHIRSHKPLRLFALRTQSACSLAA